MSTPLFGGKEGEEKKEKGKEANVRQNRGKPAAPTTSVQSHFLTRRGKKKKKRRGEGGIENREAVGYGHLIDHFWVFDFLLCLLRGGKKKGEEKGKREKEGEKGGGEKKREKRNGRNRSHRSHSTFLFKKKKGKKKAGRGPIPQPVAGPVSRTGVGEKGKERGREEGERGGGGRSVVRIGRSW